MKKFIYSSFLAVAIGAVTLSSCKKTLEEYNPSNFTAATLYTKATGFETLVNAAYTYSRFWYGKEEGFLAGEMGTDIWTSAAGDPYPMFTQYFNFQGTADPLPLLWNNLYAGVNLCNTGIASVAAVEDYTPAQKTTKEAELRFLRAFYYWHIVETWGDVNFTTVPTSGAVTEANRTPVATFYNQIFEDLKFAVANAPVTSSEYGRITVPVAKAFLARMYLTRGMNAEAFTLADDVIKNYGYALQPKFVDLWNMGNQKNKEVIWAIDYSTNLSNNDLTTLPTYPNGHPRGSNNGHLMFLMVYDQVNSALLARDINNGRPFNRYMPTLSYLKMFDQANDSRFKGSFQTVWYANKAGTYNGNAIKVGDTIAYTPNATIPVAQQSKKYITYDLANVYGANGVPLQRKFMASLSKFKDSTRTSVAEAQSSRDAFVIRLAEMYLIAAEAKLNTGDATTAATYLNVIRTRAAISGRTAQMQITPAQVTLDFILDERARELGGEQLRWFDLKRTGKLAARVAALNPDAAVNFKEYHLIRPIPQTQIDAVTNKTVFKQNPGYN